MKNTTLCYIEKDGSYLMLLRNKKKDDLNEGKWIGVGGHFLEDESPEECLIREVREETGLTLNSFLLRSVVTFVSDKYETEQMFLYTSTDFSGELIDCDEGELRWIDKKEMYDIPDRRGDSAYVSWDWDSAVQRNERADLEMKSLENAGDVLNMAQNGYIVFAVIDEKGYIMDNNEIVASGDSEFRLTYESGEDSFLFKEWTDKGHRLCSVFINDEEHIEFFSNILFVYDSYRHEYVRSIYF